MKQNGSVEYIKMVTTSLRPTITVKVIPTLKVASSTPTAIVTSSSSPTPTAVKNKLEEVKDEEILNQEKEFKEDKNIFEKLLGWILKK